MKAKFTYLVGPTYLIEIGSFRFLSDPGFDPKGTEKSEGPGHELKKNMAPPLPVEEVGKIDAVFVSHDHRSRPGYRTATPDNDPGLRGSRKT